MAKAGDKGATAPRAGAKGDPAREGRLAAALRANLKRRKLASPGAPVGAAPHKAREDKR